MSFRYVTFFANNIKNKDFFTSPKQWPKEGKQQYDFSYLPQSTIYPCFHSSLYPAIQGSNCHDNIDGGPYSDNS